MSKMPNKVSNRRHKKTDYFRLLYQVNEWAYTYCSLGMSPIGQVTHAVRQHISFENLDEKQTGCVQNFDPI